MYIYIHVYVYIYIYLYIYIECWFAVLVFKFSSYSWFLADNMTLLESVISWLGKT